jgi:hypothetical protein
MGADIGVQTERTDCLHVWRFRVTLAGLDGPFTTTVTVSHRDRKNARRLLGYRLKSARHEVLSIEFVEQEGSARSAPHPSPLPGGEGTGSRRSRTRAAIDTEMLVTLGLLAVVAAACGLLHSSPAVSEPLRRVLAGLLVCLGLLSVPLAALAIGGGWLRRGGTR